MPLQQEPSPRYKIKSLSKRLRKLSLTSPNPINLFRFAADAFDTFLTGKCTLDEAFGLKTKRGAPRKLSKAKQHLELAKKIRDLLDKEKTWDDIEAELGRDQGYLRKFYKPFRVRLSARKIISDFKHPE